MTELSWTSLRLWFVLCDKKESFQHVVYLFHLIFRCQTSVKTGVICSVPAEWAPGWLLGVCHSDSGWGKRDQLSLWSTAQGGNVRIDWGKVCRALQRKKGPQGAVRNVNCSLCVPAALAVSISTVCLDFAARLPQPSAVDSMPGSPPPALANAPSKHLCLCWCSSPMPEMFSLLSELLSTDTGTPSMSCV